MAFPLVSTLGRLLDHGPLLKDASASRNVRVLASLIGPAYRGLVRRRGDDAETQLWPGGPVIFDWRYRREMAAFGKLYEAAKSGQWNASRDLDWSREVDPLAKKALVPDAFIPVSTLPVWKKLSARERAVQRHSMLSWILSQFLHGEQGALFAAAQVTEAVPWLDAKLLGSTQVMDEARHVEVFHRYLTTKLEKLYVVNDNLYVLIDAVMSDSRWDVKFLGMQIMIEGLALGAFGTLLEVVNEPMLLELLRYVIADEARHVQYGVLALREMHKRELTAKERRDREDWAFELTLLLRNRFLAHELHDEFYGHLMSRAAWNKLMRGSALMELFRKTMFRRIVPNLRKIGLLSERVRPRYEALGLLRYEDGKSALELTTKDLVRYPKRTKRR